VRHFSDYLWTRSRSQWPRGLSRGLAAARLLRLWVRIPPGSWMFVLCECRVLSGRGSLRRADHSSRGVLPTVVRRCVWSRNLVNEEALAHCGLSRQKTNNCGQEFLMYQTKLCCLNSMLVDMITFFTSMAPPAVISVTAIRPRNPDTADCFCCSTSCSQLLTASD